MTVNSNINPNFPLPGVDQSSRGFRDNFSAAKQEIENLQSKQIQLVGGVISNPTTIDSGNGIIAVSTTVVYQNVQVHGNNHSFLYNQDGTITSSNVYYDSSNVRIGINTNTPRSALDVRGDINVGNSNVLIISSNSGNSYIQTITNTNLLLGTNGNVYVYLDTTGKLGIGMVPFRTLDVQGGEYDVARFTSTLNDTDVAVRFTTNRSNSSVGFSVENQNSFGGGLRADKNGNISLHAGELPGAGLQDGSTALTINPVSKFVGIGSQNPQDRLLVNGNLRVTGNLMVGTVPTISGSRSANAALASLITALKNIGLIIDNTSA